MECRKGHANLLICQLLNCLFAKSARDTHLMFESHSRANIKFSKTLKNIYSVEKIIKTEPKKQTNIMVFKSFEVCKGFYKEQGLVNIFFKMFPHSNLCIVQ
jgi:hypothetical protein